MPGRVTKRSLPDTASRKLPLLWLSLGRTDATSPARGPRVAVPSPPCQISDMLRRIWGEVIPRSRAYLRCFQARADDVGEPGSEGVPGARPNSQACGVDGLSVLVVHPARLPPRPGALAREPASTAWGFGDAPIVSVRPSMPAPSVSARSGWRPTTPVARYGLAEPVTPPPRAVELVAWPPALPKAHTAQGDRSVGFADVTARGLPRMVLRVPAHSGMPGQDRGATGRSSPRYGRHPGRGPRPSWKQPGTTRIGFAYSDRIFQRHPRAARGSQGVVR